MRQFNLSTSNILCYNLGMQIKYDQIQIEKFLNKYWPNDLFTLDWNNILSNSKDPQLFAAFDGDKLIGIVAYNEGIDKTYANLINMEVINSYWCNDVREALLARVIQKSSDICSETYIQVNVKNGDSQFYEDNGGVLFGNRVIFFPSVSQEVIKKYLSR